MSDKIEELRKLAENATPGPWETTLGMHPHEIDIIGDIYRDEGGRTATLFATMKGNATSTIITKANADYIAAASPDVILRLLDELADARRVIEPKPVPTEGYYILCCRHGIAEGKLLWWAPNGNGYTTDLDRAGVYSESEALKCSHADDKMIPVAKAIELAELTKPEPPHRHVWGKHEPTLKRIGNAVYGHKNKSLAPQAGKGEAR